MKLKSFNLILLLALLVTIGGVYASWSYSQGESSSAEVQKKVEMGTVVVSSPKGTIDVPVASEQLTFTIENDGSYNTKLVITGSMVITFTPADTADKDVQNNGIVFQIKVVENFGSYNEIDIFTTHEAHALNVGNPAKEFTLTAEMLASHISMTSFNLPTKADFDNFNAALVGKQFTIIISEYVAPVQP